jgi:hypothetical protein
MPIVKKYLSMSDQEKDPKQPTKTDLEVVVCSCNVTKRLSCEQDKSKELDDVEKYIKELRRKSDAVMVDATGKVEAKPPSDVVQYTKTVSKHYLIYNRTRIQNWQRKFVTVLKR